MTASFRSSRAVAFSWRGLVCKHHQTASSLVRRTAVGSSQRSGGKKSGSAGRIGMSRSVTSVENSRRCGRPALQSIEKHFKTCFGFSNQVEQSVQHERLAN